MYGDGKLSEVLICLRISLGFALGVVVDSVAPKLIQLHPQLVILVSARVVRASSKPSPIFKSLRQLFTSFSTSSARMAYGLYW
ncbi:unnamed protein product [Prunus brigantina]